MEMVGAFSGRKSRHLPQLPISKIGNVPAITETSKGLHPKKRRNSDGQVALCLWATALGGVVRAGHGDLSL